MHFSMLVVYIVLSLVYTDVESANLTITPSTNVQAGSSALTIRCSAASGLGISQLFNIQVRRSVYSNTGAGTERIVGTIIPGIIATLGSEFTQPKYRATGFFPSHTQVPGSHLHIVIQYPDCTDQAEYTCVTSAGNNQGSIIPAPEDSKNVTVQRNPDNINMYAVPDRTIYNVNQTVILTCKGDTGNARTIWSWQVQRFPYSTGWESYPDNNHIKDGIIIPTSDNKCSFSQETVLTYVVKATDNGLRTRCILDKMDEYSVNKTIYNNCNPANLNMYVVPERSIYNVNQNVILTCKGDTGNPRKIWGWQTQIFPYSTGWERYPDNNHIKDGIIIPPSGNKCSYSQETVLTYVVKATDNGLQIRCILDNMDTYTVNKGIYNHFDMVMQSQALVTFIPISGDKLDEGIGIGFVIGGIVATIVTTVIFCFILRKFKAKSDIESANLAITPSTNVQAGSSALTIRCSAARRLGITKLCSIQVKRTVYYNTGPGTEGILGSIDAGSIVTLGSGFNKPKYTATGSLTSTTQVRRSYLQIVIRNPDCTDQAEYTCITVAGNNQGTISPTPEESRNVTVQSNPDNLNMYAVPERTTYDVNQTVTLTCKGDTGNPRKIWIWQTQRFPDSTRWERYPDNNHIKDGIIIPPSGNKCCYSQETVLTYIVKATDNGLKIRCILDNMDEYSVSKHIYIIFDMITESQACVTGIPVSGDKLGEGIWIGFVIGGIVATIVTTVIFCFILRKSKAKSGEDGTVRYDEPDISRTNQRVAYVPNITVDENQPNHYNVLVNPDPPTISVYEHLKNYENVTNPESNNPSYLNMQQQL